MMQLSVIIINYRTPKLTAQAVASVYASLQKSSPLKNNLEVIVVDNDSQDNSVATLKALSYPGYKFVASRQNLGFAGGNNLGFKQATGQYVFFLNSDAVVQKGALEALLAFYQADEQQKKRRHLGLLAAQLLNADGSLQPQGGDLPNLFTLLSAQLFLDDLPVVGQLLPSVQHTGRRFNPAQVERDNFLPKGWVAGTAVLIKRDYFECLGPWDEHIFMYGEDQELSWRLHRSHLRHGILTTARVVHLGNASAGSKNAIIGEIKGYLYFFAQHKSAFSLFLAKLILWWGVLLRLCLYAWIKKDARRRDIYLSALDVVEQSLMSN